MKKVYEASTPGCSRVIPVTKDVFSGRTFSALSMVLGMVCFAVFGNTSLMAANGGDDATCSIAYVGGSSPLPPYPPLPLGQLIVCLDATGHAQLNANLIGPYTSSSNPDCSRVRIWEDAAATNELLPADANYDVDCSDISTGPGNYIQVWVTREIWSPTDPCRSAALPFKIYVADCTAPQVTCPGPITYVCSSAVPVPADIDGGTPGTQISLATFQSLGGVATDNCSIARITYSDVISDWVCTNKYVVTRTFVVRDPSGNETTCTQTITVSDNVPPTFTKLPSDLTLNCPSNILQEAAVVLAIQNWLDNFGGATNADNCGGPFTQNVVLCILFNPLTGCQTTSAATGLGVYGQMPQACSPSPREVQVGFYVTDECGNENFATAKVILKDQTAPTINPLPNLGPFTCASLVPGPNPQGVIASDNCTPTQDLNNKEWVSDVPSTVNGCAGNQTIIRTYRVTDCAGNSATRTQQISVVDNVAPTWNQNPQSQFLSCSDADLSTTIATWLTNHGGGSATDNCNGVTYSVSPTTAAGVLAAIPSWCPANMQNTRSTTVTFTATDACGNFTTKTATVTIFDIDAPNGTPPPAAKAQCAVTDVAVNTASVTDLSDNCTPANSLVVTHQGDQLMVAGTGCPGSPKIYRRTYRITDCAGNFRDVTQTITVVDDTAPTWAGTVAPLNLTCPANSGANQTAITNWLAAHTGASATDNCTNPVAYSTFPATVAEIQNQLGPCGPLSGSKTVTFIATDACGNSSTVTGVITVTDNVPPTASNPTALNVNCMSEVPAPDPNVVTTKSDACSPLGSITVTWAGDTDNGGAGCPGNSKIISRKYNVTDCSGNTKTVTQTITVLDNVNPNANCKAVTAYLGPNGSVTINATQFNDNSSDNCTGPLTYEFARDEIIGDINLIFGSYTASKTFNCSDIPPISNCASNVSNQQVIAVRLRVFDACGNESGFCSTALTLIDSVPPVINCPADMTFLTSARPAFDCTANANWTHPTPTDNCSVYCYDMQVDKEINGVFTTIDPATGTPTPFYRQPVTAGGSASYVFEKGPYCENQFGNPDNQYRVTYYVRDAYGNADTCSFLITVKDDEAPVFTYCPSTPINAQTVTGDCYQMKCWAPPTAIDNCQFPPGPCPPPTITVTTSNPTVMVDTIGDDHCALFPVGTTYVYYTATDAEGNKSTCTVTVNITDNQPPMAMCVAPFTVNMEPDGVMQLTFANIDAGSTDNCGLCAKEISRNNDVYGGTVNLTCQDVGTTVTIYLRVKDCSTPANSNVCTTQVTVQDMQSPGVATCPADITVGTASNSCTAVVNYDQPTFNDGCGSAHLGTLIQGLASGSVFPIGNTVVSYSYTSASGYTVVCSFVVTVVDDDNPTIVCPANVTNLTCLEALPAPLTLGGGFTNGTLTDNCGVTSLEFTDYDNDLTHCPYDGIRTITRRYTAFDAAGNSSSCNQVFSYIEDTEPPVLDVKPLRLHVDCLSDVPPAPYQSATDNCGVDIIDFSESAEPGQCLNQTIITRRWVAYDYCGNSSQWEQEIDVYDSIPPVLAVKPLRLHLNCLSDVPAAPYQQVTDNCGVAVVDFSESTDPGKCLNQTIITRRWVAYDLCGNTAEWEQEIDVYDSIPPVLSATPVDRTYECVEDVEAAPVQVATDNCGVVTLNFEETENPGKCLNQKIIVRRWYAYDLCGNTAEHWQFITIDDHKPPVLAVTPVDRTYECIDEVPAAPFQSVTDNCGVAFVDFSESSDPGPTSCPNQVVISRRWYAYDLCGNTTEHIQTITVNDVIRPVLAVTPLDITVTCSEGVPPMPLQTALDNCDVANLDTYETTEPGGCEDNYVVVRHWVATDLCGNTKEHSQRITVVDNTPPVFANVPASVNVSCAQNVPAVVQPTVTDNCSQVFVDFSEETQPGGCEDNFTVKRVWTATDLCGNQAVTYQLIVVHDTDKPVLANLPAATVSVECSEQVPAVAPVTASDNCGEPLVLQFSEVEIPGTCTNQYQIKRTWSAQDDCGNSTSFIQLITISDTKAPVLAGLPPATVSVECSEQVPAVPVVTATDNCVKPIVVQFSEVEIPGTCPNQYQIARTWSAQDDCGNFTSFLQVITISDTKAPVLAGLPAATVSVECSEQVPAVPVVTATDNCAAPIVLQFSEVEIPGTCPNQYQITRTWSAQDDCGNATSFVQTITINDTKAPVLVGLPAATVSVECSEQVPAVPVVTATDNCVKPIVVQFSEVEIPGTCPNQYQITRTWSAQDDCGNATSFVQTITINDSKAPVLVGLPAATVSVECSEQVPAVPVVTATDNCVKPIVVDFSEVEIPGTCPNQYQITRTWSAQDDCGNATSFVQTITINDSKAPVLVGLPAATVSVECSEQVPAVPVVTATDNCVKPIVVQFSEVEIPGTCPNQYQITRTWSAQDDCGNATSFVQTITINDSKAPVLAGLPAATVSVECSEQVPAVPVVTATDNCIKPIVVDFSEVEIPGTCPNQYQITRTWSAQDDCGNATSFVQTITISDTKAPVLVGLPASTFTTDCAEKVPAVPVVTATDNCIKPIVVQFSEVEIPGTCSNQYQITRTWSAQDDCGNATSFVQTITINDTQAPVLTNLPPAVVNVVCASDVPAVPNPAVGATDNCNKPIDVDFTEVEIPGTCVNKYTIKRTWTAADDCGNSTVFTQTININDNVAPELYAKPIRKHFDCIEDVEIAPYQFATDNCGVATVEFSETSDPGSCPNSTIINRRWVAYDLCGNSSTWEQEIDVLDTIAPVLTITPVDLTFECFDEVPTAPLGLGATDNCGVVTVDYSESTSGGALGDPNWSCPNKVVVTRRWVAFDLCGNTAEHIQTITVFDDIPPAFVVTPVDRNYQCLEDVPPAPTEGVIAQDNCEVVFVDFLETTDNDVCQNRVIIKRKWEATDACGNKNTHWQTLTVFDDQKPVLANLPAATVNVECSEQVPAKAAVTATDNCNTPIDLDFTEVEVPGTCPNQYQVIRTWTASDVCGNTTSFVQTITVSDTKAPVWTSALPGNLTLQCGETVPPAATLTASDNCNAPVDIELSETFLPGSGPNDGAKLVRTWTAEDDCGNSTVHTQTITIDDLIAPVLVGTPAAAVTVECSEQVPALAVVTATDNCQGTVDVEVVEIEIPGTCPNQYQITRTWTAVDFAGNSTIFVQTITVNDTKAPTLVGLPVATVSVECSEQVPAVPVVTATDNCIKPIVVDFSEVEIPGTCPNQYQITRTWSAQDDCGNATSFVQTITINDTKAPVLVGLPAATVSVECSEQVPAVPVVTATDNCIKPIVVQFSEVEIPGTCPNQYQITRTWSAQDDCGNATSFVQTITINDTKAPVLVGLPAATVSVECSEQVPAVPVVTATDNCIKPIVVDFSEVEIPGTCPNQYQITRTWSAQDDCGNATSFVQTITINDTKAPVLVGLPVATVNVSCSENVPAVPVVTATDNCIKPIVVQFSEVEIPGTCPNQYAITRTWSAQDDCGNATSFVQTITISDTQAPVLVGLPVATVNVSCSENVPAVPVVTATDNCIKPIVVQFSEVEIPGTCPNQYAITRTWSAQDDCGNATSFVQTITINDTQAPVFNDPLPTASISLSCGETVPAAATLTATDNCNAPVDVELSETFLPGSGPNDGAQIVRTWTAEDDCGNITTYVQTITINDAVAPVLVGLPAATVNVSCSENVPAVAAVTATDNCQGTITVQFSEVEIPGTCANQYAITRTWTATDFAGNSTAFVQTITINDTTAPTWNQPAPATPINVKGAADVPPVPALTATDNCAAPVYVDFSETTVQGNCLNRFTLTRTWVAQDDCGNSTSRQQVIVVNDDVPPVISCPPALTAQCSPAEQPPYANLNEFIAAGGSASDNNGLNVNSFGMISEVKNGNVYTRTYRVSDECGNSATCQQTVTVTDTQAPTFLNCPNVNLVFGNDPDKCSAKINWPAPVAVDNCSIPTVVQTAGPTSGSIVAVGTYTIAFRATDAAGNVSTCSFTVMVMDTQNPTFDADVVMPADVTVECNAVPAPFVLTNNDVSDNCTPSAQLVITFTEVRTDGSCKFNYILTRTWKVTDQAGNMLVHTQKVTVRDTKAPTALCKNIAVTLDKAGNASITGADVNNGSSDNCSAAANLTFSVTPSAFDCSKVGPNVVTLTVTDECGNSATCTATVTVAQGIGPCTPQYSVKTTCLNNATTLDNGQFTDVITVKSLAMQTWTLTANTGLYSTASPAPPAAPVALAVGTVFTSGTADGIDNDGDGQTDEADEMIFYTLKGVHVEGVGYSIQVKNNLNTTGTISNKGYYPSPYFVNLNDPFCLNTPPFVIQVGEYNNAQGNVINVTVDGVATTTFNASALGIGFHTVMATFDAGTPTTNLVVNGQVVGGTDAQAQADPGCQQKITKIVQITNTPTTVVCNDLVYVSIHNDGGDCVFAIAPDDVLEGSYLCDDDYSVVLTYPFGTHTFNPANRVDYTHIGKTIKYSLVHAISGNVCWGNIKVEDKEAPLLTCPANITVKCSDPTDVSFTGKLIVSDCNPTVNTIVTDDFTDFGSCNSPRAKIVRTWVSTDGYGNQASCSQVITIAPFALADVDFPADITISCENFNSSDPNVTGAPSINGTPIGTGGLCMASVSHTDDYYDICPGSYEIVRTWKVRNMCLPVSSTNPTEHAQVIKITDTHGPAFTCPGNITVSTDPFSCCASAPLPDVIISEGCSYVTSLTYKVVGNDIATGNLVIYEGSGSLSDFPGNNWWNPDTLGVFGFTQCLPRGEYTVTYTAKDACDNVTKCTFKMTVEDQIPPISACDQWTQVALGGDGMAFVNASTFNDGSYDVCESVNFKARRMNKNDCQDETHFYDQVKFCCSDINDTILVVFRVYDIPTPAGPVELDFGAGHWNDCMVQVLVEDKIKPLCNAPANTTVSCENFDPSLWVYGAATGADNCCIDTITSTVSYSLFDTVCNRGTITRNFRVFDCAGNSAQCSQRVFVNYEQDYYVKFPNDVIVTVCDGTGNYGEPSFYGKDCELLGVSHEDEIFTVVPDACYKIERTWTILNWCTYNPNAGCINVPNPNPNAISNHPSNLTGPTVSPAGTPAPWNPTVLALTPGATPTNFSIYWDANANCYKYKQIIKVIDGQKPIIENCPSSPQTVCDITPNDAQLWNESYWYDNTIKGHNLCEAPTDLSITSTDLCSGASVNVRYLLFLDLDGDGTMETVVSSTNLPGFNNVYYNNASTPNFGGGSPRQFDERPVLPNQKYGFALQTTIDGTKKVAAVRWNTQQSPNTYVVPELPYGTHKIKWIVEDGCGNETVCEYTFIVKDCKAPTVVCLNGLSVNIMPTKMIQMWANDFLQYTEDNCTPSSQIVIGIRRSGTGTGFPLNPDGTPQTSVTFTCDDLGTQLVELWAMDAAGNADYCETYVIVQDNNNNCNGPGAGVVAGTLATEANNGLEEANVELDGSHPALPPTTLFDFSDNKGHYEFNAVPFLGDYTVTPVKDNDPLNGVSTFDLVLINKHILGLEPLNSPYKMIGADANNSRSITTFDIVELRKLILGIYTELPNNTSWRFVDASYSFPNPANPFQEIFPETKQIASMLNNTTGQNFVAQKVGDVNGNAVASSLVTSDDRTSGTLLFDVKDRSVKAGETFTVNFHAAERVMGYQFTLYFPNLEVVDVTAGSADMKLENFGIFNSDHALTTSFDNEHVVGDFTVTFRAKGSGMLNEMLAVSSRITKAEAYNLNREPQSVALRFNGDNGTTISGLGFELYQNQPNPWMNKTQVGFYLPEAAHATMTIYDETGRTLFTQAGDFAKGYNAIAIERALINTTGVLYYKLETATDSAVKKMIQTK